MSNENETKTEHADDSEEKGVVDGVSLLYVAFGIPAMWLFIVVLFAATMVWDLPA